MHATLPLLVNTDFPPLRRTELQTLQVNLGYLCNQSCLHCHVNAGPKRTELMTWETMTTVLEFLESSSATSLDLTGGAPELNPKFRDLVDAATQKGHHVIDRCNLTVLLEPGQEDLGQFLAEHAVEICASLPCYLEENVDGQRGDGVFARSIEAIRGLNMLGYGLPDTGLELNLVYNPTGPWLPPEQTTLETDYKRELLSRYGIRFNHLFTITNMPIQRFGSTLVSKGQFEEYMHLLRASHQSANLDSVMCRSLLSVDWQGYLYDCDFNQMLGINYGGKDRRIHLGDLDPHGIPGQGIAVAGHCYGCTAGGGSSCGGALD